MSKLREMIRHQDTHRRSTIYPRLSVTQENVGYDELANAEIWRAQLVVAVDYKVSDGSIFARPQCASNAEDQLLHFLYEPLLKHVYALRSAVSSGDNKEAMEILGLIFDEVRP